MARLTLKALANVSPGFALKPWVQTKPGRLFATLKGLRGFAVNKRLRNSFRVGPSRNGIRFPRVAKAQPWAGIGERFQRYSFELEGASLTIVSLWFRAILEGDFSAAAAGDCSSDCCLVAVSAVASANKSETIAIKLVAMFMIFSPFTVSITSLTIKAESRTQSFNCGRRFFEPWPEMFSSRGQLW
jgi:hypothetical protein